MPTWTLFMHTINWEILVVKMFLLLVLAMKVEHINYCSYFINCFKITQDVCFTIILSA